MAVTGSIVATTASAGFTSASPAASPAAWAVVAGCGVAVLVVGLASTGPWARRTAARDGERLIQPAQEGSDDRSAAAVR